MAPPFFLDLDSGNRRGPFSFVFLPRLGNDSVPSRLVPVKGSLCRVPSSCGNSLCNHLGGDLATSVFRRHALNFNGIDGAPAGRVAHLRARRIGMLHTLMRKGDFAAVLGRLRDAPAQFTHSRTHSWVHWPIREIAPGRFTVGCGYRGIHAAIAAGGPIGQRPMGGSTDSANQRYLQVKGLWPGKPLGDLHLWYLYASAHHLADDIVLVRPPRLRPLFMLVHSLPAAHPHIERGNGIRTVEDIDVIHDQSLYLMAA